jgi:1-acyl-sn-glycerol-3-phosphate acyltransferase
MEILRRMLSFLFKCWMILSFAIPFFLFLPFYLIFLPFPSLLTPAYHLTRIHCFVILTFSGIWVRKKYLFPRAELPQPCVFVANHTSYLDILISYGIIPHYFIFMGKAELGKIPIFNLFFKHMHVLVDRKSRVGSHKAFVDVGKKIDEGTSVYIFPEGTIATEGKLKPLKNGAFKLAIDKQVPIVPIVYKENWKLLQNGGFFKSLARPGFACATIFPPIETKGMNDENLVSLRNTIEEIFKKNLPYN